MYFQWFSLTNIGNVSTQIICNINSGPPDTGGNDNWNRKHSKENIDYLIKLGNQACNVGPKGYGVFSCSYGESVDVANDSVSSPSPVKKFPGSMVTNNFTPQYRIRISI